MNLKELRKSKGLTQEEASAICNIPLRSYKRYETDADYSKSFKYQNIFKIIESFSKSDKKHTNKVLNIAIAGCGYVGFSIGVLLSQCHKVTMVDTIQSKVDLISNKKSPFVDKDIEEWLAHKKLNITATTDGDSAYSGVDMVIIATPTNFDSETNSFDTTSVDAVYKQIRKANRKVLIVIKSTIPIGFTEQYKDERLIFSPEFLREGCSLKDNLMPSRIIVGCDIKPNALIKSFANAMHDAALNSPSVLYMTSREAESVKLFANSYLAMRVAYFNELDTYAEMNGLDSREIIKGISLDPRVGDYYNNPSFGYGGYCLPKDTAQLKSSFLDIPNNNLIKAIVESNQSRKQFVANRIVELAKKKTGKEPKDITIGVYRLIMKTGSDNYRSSAVIDVINYLKEYGINVLVYEINKPSLDFEFTSDLRIFKTKSDLIISNRYSKDLDDVLDKTYTRDLFVRD